MRCKQTRAFRTLERSSVPPYSQYFHCNHIPSKEDGSALPKESTWREFGKVRIRLNHQVKNFNLEYTFKYTQNSYRTLFTLVKEQLQIIIKLRT